MKKIKVAVIGYGHLGKWHVEKALALHQQVELVAIVESRETVRVSLKEKYPHIQIVPDLNTIKDGIDAAIVVTPTSSHFEICKNLLSSKCHVFCEKPLSLEPKEIIELQQISKLNQLILQVGHSERFHEVWSQYRSVFQSFHGHYTVRSNRVAPFKGRAVDVDVIQDLMIHDLDLILWLFAHPPTQVMASGAKIRTNHWDQVTAHFFDGKGHDYYVTVGRNHVKEMRDLEVYGNFGTYYVDLFHNQFSYAHPAQFEDGQFVMSLNYPKRDHLLEEQKCFFQSIASLQPPVVSAFDALRASHLMKATLKSLETGQLTQISL